LRELESLGPFGPGNPEPVFSIRAFIQNHRILKGRHLKLGLSSPTDEKIIEAIWFHAAEDEAHLSDEFLKQQADWAGVPEINRFRGQTTPSLRIRDRHSLEGFA
jgi:single-stranded-DNA-specific exonuclease